MFGDEFAAFIEEIKSAQAQEMGMTRAEYDARVAELMTLISPSPKLVVLQALSD